MKDKTNDDCTRGFRAVEGIIDAAVAATKVEFESKGYSYVEHSNRSGFDMSGYAYHTLEIEFYKDLEDAPFTVRDAVRIRYEEPLTWETDRVVFVSATRDTFQKSTQSTPASIMSIDLDTENLTDDRVQESLRECLRAHE